MERNYGIGTCEACGIQYQRTGNRQALCHPHCDGVAEVEKPAEHAHKAHYDANNLDYRAADEEWARALMLRQAALRAKDRIAALRH